MLGSPYVSSIVEKAFRIDTIRAIAREALANQNLKKGCENDRR